MKKNNQVAKQYFFLFLIVLTGAFIRIYFYTGHIFSDDAYYSYLSYSMLNGDLTNEYLGYPVFPLRLGFIGLTSLSMKLFGINEFATVVFLFMSSLLNIFLTYKPTKPTQLFSNNNKIAITAAFIIAFFPTDIIFATICFPDLIYVFFINLGFYFLIKSYKQKKNIYSYLGGVSFFLSMQIKENAYYVLILLIVLLVYSMLKNRQFKFQLLFGILCIVGNYLIEGIIYLLLHNDYFYRIITTNTNYSFSYYDFFSYTG